DPEEAGVVIIATGGRSFSLLFLGGAAERDEFAELEAQRCLLRVSREEQQQDHYLVRSARAEGDGQTFQVLRGCLLLKMIRAVGAAAGTCNTKKPWIWQLSRLDCFVSEPIGLYFIKI
ncbi:hypothetical protein AK812_SmicGene45499, partial [Symbiodinium microadriaticum]